MAVGAQPVAGRSEDLLECRGRSGDIARFLPGLGEGPGVKDDPAVEPVAADYPGAAFPMSSTASGGLPAPSATRPSRNSRSRTSRPVSPLEARARDCAADASAAARSPSRSWTVAWNVSDAASRSPGSRTGPLRPTSRLRPGRPRALRRREAPGPGCAAGWISSRIARSSRRARPPSEFPGGRPEPSLREGDRAQLDVGFQVPRGFLHEEELAVLLLGCGGPPGVEKEVNRSRNRRIGKDGGGPVEGGRGGGEIPGVDQDLSKRRRLAGWPDAPRGRIPKAAPLPRPGPGRSAKRPGCGRGRGCPCPGG